MVLRKKGRKQKTILGVPHPADLFGCLIIHLKTPHVCEVQVDICHFLVYIKRWFKPQHDLPGGVHLLSRHLKVEAENQVGGLS